MHIKHSISQSQLKKSSALGRVSYLFQLTKSNAIQNINMAIPILLQLQVSLDQVREGESQYSCHFSTIIHFLQSIYESQHNDAKSNVYMD